MIVELITEGGTPCYAIRTDQAVAQKIHGATFDRENARWLYPAYAPFDVRVFHDINIAFKGISWSAEATAQHLACVASEEALRQGVPPPGLSFVTKPFDHQREGVNFLYYRPRAALLWAMGTGKSKVIVDYFSLFPGERMLIITPKVTLHNWVREFNIHGRGEKIGVLDGERDDKLELLHNYRQYQVIVASYASARNFGFPILQKRTLAAIKAAGERRKLTESGSINLAAACRKLSDAEDQIKLVEMWAQGATMVDVNKAANMTRSAVPQYIGDMEYHHIVADESHNLLSNTSDQTKAVKALARKAARRTIASGTVALGDPLHLYAQLQVLSSALTPENYLDFQNFFVTYHPYNKHKVLGYKNLPLLNERLDRVATRKTREECLTLPERQIFDLTFELEGDQRALYNKLVTENGADLAALFEDGTCNLEIANRAVLLNKLGQVCSGFILEPIDTGVCNGCPKLAKCVTESIRPYSTRCTETSGPAPTREVRLKANPKLALVDELLDEVCAEASNKVIIWAQHTAELTHLEELLEKRKLPFVRVDGAATKVQQKVDAFNKDPALRVYLGQVATGIGITLTAATTTIYYSTDWSLGTYLQSLDRNYRAGQTKKVVVYRLFGKDSVELFKAAVLEEKEELRMNLSAKLACSACPDQQRCAKDGVALFDKACRFSRSLRRTTATAKELL